MIPINTTDFGQVYYDQQDKKLFNYEGEMVRLPTKTEIDQIEVQTMKNNGLVV
jgi:hypothetical protein